MATFILSVAANHENDTCFENRLVMGSADCMYCIVDLVKTPEKLKNHVNRLDHQVALIAQSVEHRKTDPRVVGSFPTQVNKIFQSFHECVR